jgi:hypothetical protein
MLMLQVKALAVAEKMSPNAGGGILAGLLPILIQVITSLLGSGGLTLCQKPTSGAAVQQVLASPTRRQQRIMRRTVNAYFDDPTTAATAEESLLEVGQEITADDAWQLYQECNAENSANTAQAG